MKEHEIADPYLCEQHLTHPSLFCSSWISVTRSRIAHRKSNVGCHCPKNTDAEKASCSDSSRRKRRGGQRRRGSGVKQAAAVRKRRVKQASGSMQRETTATPRIVSLQHGAWLPVYHATKHASQARTKPKSRGPNLSVGVSFLLPIVARKVLTREADRCTGNLIHVSLQWERTQACYAPQLG